MQLCLIVVMIMSKLTCIKPINFRIGLVNFLSTALAKKKLG